MRRRISLRVLPLCALCLALTGCVWLRLLAFKNQLAEFDRYVQVEESEGLTLRFSKPVIYSQDVLFLMSLEPTRRETNGSAQTWWWTFRKLPAPGSTETGNFDLNFRTTFEGNRLASFSLDERFLASIPKPLLLGTMRSLGQADIDKKRRSATMRWMDRGTNTGAWESLTRQAVLRLLGEPYELATTNAVSTSVYRYRLDTPTRKKDESLLARVKFSFREDTERLASVDAAYGQFKIAYDPSAGRPGPRPAADGEPAGRPPLPSP